MQMSSVFLNSYTIQAGQESIVPLYLSGFYYDGNAAADITVPKSKVGRMVVGTNIKIPLWVNESNTDIYVAFYAFNNGCTNGIVRFDGEVIRSDLNLSSSFGEVEDIETLIKKKAKQGFHYIEINSNSTSLLIGATYIRTRKNIDNIYNQIPSAITVEDYKTLAENVVITNTADTKYFLTDIPTSNFVSTQTIVFKAQLSPECGILLNWNRVSENTVGSGIILRLDLSTKYLLIAEVKSSTVNQTPLGSTDLSTSSHEYKIIMDTSNGISVYVDGTLMGTMTSSQFYGGCLGFYVYGAVSQKYEYIRVTR
jgi:hypothetical protein